MKKRVMYVIQSAGGVERYIQMLFKYLDRTQFENILVCSHDYKEENYISIVDKFINLDMRREFNFFVDLKGILRIRKLIKQYKPDILYLHSSKAGALGRVADFGIRNKVIYNPHGWAFCMDCSEKKKALYRFVEKCLSVKTNIIVAISQCEKNRALNNRICKTSKIKVILNGIDIAQYDKDLLHKVSIEKLGIPKNAYVIGLVGRICHNKAPEVFLKAATIIKKSIPEAYFILVGDGSDYKQIEKLIKDYNIEESTFITGWTDRPFDYINCFNQGMLLTRWEGFGLVLTEYMIAKVPLIATNIDSIPELVIDGVNGLLVNVDDPEGTAAASIRIFEDSKLGNDMAEKGNEIVRSQFDVKRVVKEHEILFNQLLSKESSIVLKGGNDAKDFSNNGSI